MTQHLCARILRRPATRYAIAAVGVACLLLPAVARADGDPASDVLLYEKWYLPYRAPSAAAKSDLTAVVAAANRAGYPIRVAVIQSPTDLGSIPQLFGKPQTYASFLAQELAFGYRKRVLVVMPAGFGFSPGLVKATGAQADSGTGYAPVPDVREMKLVAKLAKPPGAASDQLVAAAEKTVRALAKADGHTLPAHPTPPAGAGGSTTSGSGAPVSSSGGSSLSPARIAVAVVAALVVLSVGLGAVALVLRRSQGSGPADGDAG
jgi:hypothetical protein